MISPTSKWIDEKSLPRKWRPGGAERELFEKLVLQYQATQRAKGSIHFFKIMPESRPKKPSGNFIRKLEPWEYPAPPPEAPKKILLSPPKLMCRDAEGKEIRLKEFLANKIRDAVAKEFGSEPKGFIEWPWRFRKIEANSKEGSMDLTVKAKDSRTLSLNEALAEAIRAQVRRESEVRGKLQ